MHITSEKNEMRKYFSIENYVGKGKELLHTYRERLLSPKTAPVSRRFGFDRGTPIDRYYIERFLDANRDDIRGVVLEIGDSTYGRLFGENVERFEVLHFTSNNPSATLVGDLAKSETLPENIADAFICTQTFNFIYDCRAAARGAYQLLKPGGILLATVSGISQISRYDMDKWGDYWRFTTLSAQKMFEDAFGKGNVEVRSFGNCLAAKNFLDGRAAEELQPGELDWLDPDYQVLIAIRAVKK